MKLARHPPDASSALARISGDADKGVLASSTAIERVLGNVFLTLSLPVEFSAHSLKVVNVFFSYVADRLYQTPLEISLDEAKSTWMPMMFADEGTVSCSIALMQACNELFLGGGESSPKALYYLSQTFAQVRKRLHSPDALSDSTISTVLSLIIQELIRKDQPGAKIHFAGLIRMVELRGGLEQLENNLPLLIKICKVDVTYALQYGGPTAFFRDRMPELRKSLASKGLSLDCTSAVSSIPYDGLEPYLQDILLDVMSISSLFNSDLSYRTLDFLTFQEMNYSICFRLLRFRPLGHAGQGSGIQAAYHTGLTIFVITLFLQHTHHRRIQDYELVSMRLREVFDSGLDDLDDGLVLWLMILGSIWTTGDVDGDWLLPKISSEAQRLGLKTWDDARDIICKFPWINALHERPGRAVWRQVNHEI
ncbi:hypothetical protein DL764_010538 [Monosporascus ibericus]|uniref:Transcription factor domain-containing protein n=1 Tax=Monosporascus ibericus TaxID=155417 RepID=A0A4Q4SV38_9PEZI|nr:hypothetical protein DL764_010538 [Monosporascus ibericus]